MSTVQLLSVCVMIFLKRKEIKLNRFFSWLPPNTRARRIFLKKKIQPKWYVLIWTPSEPAYLCHRCFHYAGPMQSKSKSPISQLETCRRKIEFVASLSLSAQDRNFNYNSIFFRLLRCRKTLMLWRSLDNRFFCYLFLFIRSMSLNHFHNFIRDIKHFRSLILISCFFFIPLHKSSSLSIQLLLQKEKKR